MAPYQCRLMNAKGEICVSFAFRKARVAALKYTTIPRMEVTALVLAVRLDNMLRTELQFTLTDSVLWSDNMTSEIHCQLKQEI